MTKPPVARLAFLSQPSPGVFMLNLQVDGQDSKVEITRDQLRGIIMDGTAAAWLERKGVEA